MTEPKFIQELGERCDETLRADQTARLEFLRAKAEWERAKEAVGKFEGFELTGEKRPATENEWYWKFPLDVYALGPVEAKDEKDSRRKAREWSGVSRLPAGFKTWRA